MRLGRKVLLVLTLALASTLAASPAEAGLLSTLSKARAQASQRLSKAARTFATGWKTEFGALSPAPVLEDPTVMISGLFLHASTYKHMAGHLGASGKNGRVAVFNAADGRFHSGSVRGPVISDQEAARRKLFALQYENPNESPYEKVPQLGSAIDRIAAVTGKRTLNVITHSEGATDFRLYLQTRSAEQKKIGFRHAIFVNPMSHGTWMGNLGARLGFVLGLERAARDLSIGSPLVKWLNDNWEAQRAQVHKVTQLALTGVPTLDRYGLTSGDGFTTPRDVTLPGAETIAIRGLNPTALAHGLQLRYPGIISTIAERLRH